MLLDTEGSWETELCDWEADAGVGAGWAIAGLTKTHSHTHFNTQS